MNCIFLVFQGFWATGDRLTFNALDQHGNITTTRYYYIQTWRIASKPSTMCSSFDSAMFSYILQSPSVKHISEGNSFGKRNAKLLSCVGIILTNLAEPKWILIRCHEKLEQVIYCMPKKSSKTILSLHEQSNEEEFCSSASLFVGGLYHQFLFTHSSPNLRNHIKYWSIDKF